MPASCPTYLRPEHEPTALPKAMTGGEEKRNAGHTDDLTGVVDLLLKLNITYLGGRYFLAMLFEIYILEQFLPEKGKQL